MLNKIKDFFKLLSTFRFCFEFDLDYPQLYYGRQIFFEDFKLDLQRYMDFQSENKHLAFILKFRLFNYGFDTAISWNNWRKEDLVELTSSSATEPTKDEERKDV